MHICVSEINILVDIYHHATYFHISYCNFVVSSAKRSKIKITSFGKPTTTLTGLTVNCESTLRESMRQHRGCFRRIDVMPYKQRDTLEYKGDL